MITLYRSTARCFVFLEIFLFLLFLEHPRRIIGSFMWRLQKELPISNSKIGWGGPYPLGVEILTNLVSKCRCPDLAV